MACTRPIGGYRYPGGEIKLRPDGAWSELAEVQCGQCADCRIEKGRQWAIRCQHEAQMHQANAFITLTYDEEHIPADHSLDVREWQLFAKKLRNELGPFRFMHVGEYGELEQRPHYHALIFGQAFDGDRECVRVDPGNGRRYYQSKTLERLWGKGFHDLQELAPESVSYVCKYALKKVLGTSDEAEELRRQRYERVDAETGETWMVKPEYATMSRRPGIGTTWFDKYASDLFPGDFVVINGKKAPVPKFYLDKQEEKDPEMVMRLKAKRKKSAAARAADNTPERRKVKEALTKAKLSLAAQRKL
ncbi:MAG: replication initiator protein [Microvirus sp.]|nr:MAG: replication initiator protein [Microvirus sp.]